MLLKVFFWLVSLHFSCIISNMAIDTMPTDESCAKNYLETCKLRHCKNWYTNNTARREFIELSTQNTTELLLEFYVIGSSDCHVHLSPVVNPNQTDYGVYDFLIGGFNNSRTVVRNGRKILRDSRTANVLSESQPVQIRIETSKNIFIQIYRDNELLLETIDRGLAPVRYFRFATDQTDGMDFYYDCMHLSSPAPQISTTYFPVFALIPLYFCMTYI